MGIGSRTLMVALFVIYFLQGYVAPILSAGELTIEYVKSTQGLRELLGKKVDVAGVFAQDPVPLLVTDLKVVLLDRPMPRESYLVLVGPKVKELEPRKLGGAKIIVHGVLRRPAGKDPPYSKEEPAVLEVVDFKVLELARPPYSPWRLSPKELAEWWVTFCKKHAELCFPLVCKRFPWICPPRTVKYAVLVSGGYNEKNNRVRYWNDIAFMYTVLKNRYGYAPSNIYVLYADGVNPDPANVDTPNFYSATRRNLEMVFSQLRERVRGSDFVFIFLNNHGVGYDSRERHNYGGRYDRSGEENDMYDEGLCLWHTIIYDDEFANLLSDIRGRLVIVMKQCFSGGFIKDLSGSNRVVISSCGENEPSWGRRQGDYGEFTFHFMAAVNGQDPYNNIINADTNSDDRISMVEGFNYARYHDTAPETPHYDDNGDGTPHTGDMPRGGDGALGSNTPL